MVFIDWQKNEYEITWDKPDVLVCGFFSGTIHNVHEWIYANLGWGRKIKSIKNAKTGFELFIGKKVQFKEPQLSYHEELEWVKMYNGTIKGFHVDAYYYKGGKLMASFEERIGTIDIAEIEEIDFKLREIL